jgi:hypothetical protein
MIGGIWLQMGHTRVMSSAPRMGKRFSGGSACDPRVRRLRRFGHRRAFEEPGVGFADAVPA